MSHGRRMFPFRLDNVARHPCLSPRGLWTGWLDRSGKGLAGRPVDLGVFDRSGVEFRIAWPCLLCLGVCLWCLLSRAPSIGQGFGGSDLEITVLFTVDCVNDSVSEQVPRPVYRIHDVITVHAQRGLALFRVDAVRDG